MSGLDVEPKCLVQDGHARRAEAAALESESLAQKAASLIKIATAENDDEWPVHEGSCTVHGRRARCDSSQIKNFVRGSNRLHRPDLRAGAQRPWLPHDLESGAGLAYLPGQRVRILNQHLGRVPAEGTHRPIALWRGFLYETQIDIRCAPWLEHDVLMASHLRGVPLGGQIVRNGSTADHRIVQHACIGVLDFRETRSAKRNDEDQLQHHAAAVCRLSDPDCPLAALRLFGAREVGFAWPDRARGLRALITVHGNRQIPRRFGPISAASRNGSIRTSPKPCRSKSFRRSSSATGCM